MLAFICHHFWYQSRLKMSPRQGQMRGVPVGRGLGRQDVETDTQMKLREIQARMEAMERKNSKNTDTIDEEECSEDE